MFDVMKMQNAMNTVNVSVLMVIREMDTMNVRKVHKLCAGVQCHRFGQCYENRCYCSHGYVGDGVNFCDAHANDPCDGVRCAANGRCQDGRCVCDPGYTGDGYNECREAEGVKLCGNVQCHQYATCDRGQCRCVTGYDGDGYSDCRPVTEG
ncbi:unnamed protein product [Schistosoma curassoni]|uniref:EGF-like domain-containing protein n=1 Tax=Schistosoma curassoni TaxID=6186 RepID=A0A183KQ40_9TREM|nr:unnamed protein product [Schistosoma curassoni]